MAFAYDFQPEHNLVIIVFRGEITPAEEATAFETVVQDDRLQPDSKFLVERTDSQTTVGPADVNPHLALIQRHGDRLGMPRLAIIVGRDRDFGMMRVLEAHSEGAVNHHFNVFREVEQACAWLGIDPQQVRWPQPTDET